MGLDEGEWIRDEAGKGRGHGGVPGFSVRAATGPR